jgi:hypothetical protein
LLTNEKKCIYFYLDPRSGTYLTKIFEKLYLGPPTGSKKNLKALEKKEELRNNHTEPNIFDPYEEAAVRNKALIKEVFGRKLPSYCMWDCESVGHPETWAEW